MFYSYFCEIDGMENYVVHVDLCTTPPLSCIYPLLFFITCDLYIRIYGSIYIKKIIVECCTDYEWGKVIFCCVYERKKNITSFMK